MFQEMRLPLGRLKHRGQAVDCSKITRTALLTVEGERDDICSIGQTVAAHDLCSGIRPYLKQHHVQTGVGHYGVFSGRRWQQQIYPLIREVAVLEHQFARNGVKVMVVDDSPLAVNLVQGGLRQLGYTEGTVITDSPIVYDDPENQNRWKPSNYSEDFVGDVLLRTARLPRDRVPDLIWRCGHAVRETTGSNASARGVLVLQRHRQPLQDAPRRDVTTHHAGTEHQNFAALGHVPSLRQLQWM